MTKLNEVACEYFQRSLKINDERRYEITLPWLKLRPVLPEGRDIAERRSRTNIFEDYQDVIQILLSDRTIDKVKKDNLGKPGYYLPHRAVMKKSPTIKIGLVFYASARTKNYPSLNECLAKGPNLLQFIQQL